MNEEEVKKGVEEGIKTTEGGYKYIVNAEGLKIRDSILNRRIDEDGETTEEYKIRRKLVKVHEKNKRNNPKMLWHSRLWGTLTKERAMQVRAAMEKRYKTNKEEEK